MAVRRVTENVDVATSIPAGDPTNTGRGEDALSVRERILAAAIHEFAVSGFHRTSLRAVCDRSGSNKPMVYYHFHGKDGLYLAAVQRQLEETAEQLRDALRDHMPALAKLRRFAEVYLDAFVVSRPLMGTALHELESLERRLRASVLDEYVRLIGAKLHAILMEGVELGEFRRIDVEDCMVGVTSILIGAIRLYKRPADQLMHTAVSQLMDYYAAGLLAPDALSAWRAEQADAAPRSAPSRRA